MWTLLVEKRHPRGKTIIEDGTKAGYGAVGVASDSSLGFRHGGHRLRPSVADVQADRMGIDLVERDW
jgi:hypothetical protein